jgi:hypothetical protein
MLVIKNNRERYPNRVAGVLFNYIRQYIQGLQRLDWYQNHPRIIDISTTTYEIRRPRQLRHITMFNTPLNYN